MQSLAKVVPLLLLFCVCYDVIDDRDVMKFHSIPSSAITHLCRWTVSYNIGLNLLHRDSFYQINILT